MQTAQLKTVLLGCSFDCRETRAVEDAKARVRQDIRIHCYGREARGSDSLSAGDCVGLAQTPEKQE